MTRSARLLALALALFLGVAVLIAPATSTAEPKHGSRGPTVPTLTWTDCEDGFECATAKVPLDYDRPHGRQIELALIRLPATDQANRIGSLFLNPGGPGGSGVSFVREAGPFLIGAEVRARFDLVGFDPRGISLSSPLICFDTFDEALAAYATPYAFPKTPAEEQVWAAADMRFADGCAQKHPAILDHMSTADVARDLDLLRRAVGDDKLTYAGYSYGTYLGATYANLFPSKVRALVVDGVLDPVAWSTGRRGEGHRVPFSTRVRGDVGARDTLRQFFKLCDAAGDGCAFSTGDPRWHFRVLAHRLLKHPIQLPDGNGGTFEYGYDFLIGDMLGSLYDPASWAETAEGLAFLEDAVANPTAKNSRRAAAGLPQLGDRAQAAEIPYDNIFEGFPGVGCADTNNPNKLSAWSRAGAAADRQYGYFGRIWTWISSICLPWPGHADDRYLGPWNHRTANPVLVVGNLYDPATRYQGAVTLSRLLPGSRLLTLNGWGHTSLFKSSCIDDYVIDYLVRGGLPPRGTVCPSLVVPFKDQADARRPSPLQVLPPPPFVRRDISS